MLLFKRDNELLCPVMMAEIRVVRKKLEDFV
jgi:hypothetical protein